MADDQTPQGMDNVHPLHDPNYPNHFEFPGLPEHFTLISAQKTDEPHNEDAHQMLGQELTEKGFQPQPVRGERELYFMVAHGGTDEHHQQIQEMAWKRGQEFVIHSSGEKNRMVYHDGRERQGQGMVHGPFLDAQFIKLQSGHKFQLNLEDSVEKADLSTYDKLAHQAVKEAVDSAKPHHYGAVGSINVFHATHAEHEFLPGIHIEDPTDEDFEKAISLAEKQSQVAVFIHGNPPPILQEKAPAAEFPHAYDWYDIPEQVAKAISDPKAPTGQDQMLDKASDSYPPIAQIFGEIIPNAQTNLHFYLGLEKLEAEVDKLIQKKGFQVVMAGGHNAIPNFAEQNYATKQLVIWDPSSSTVGGNFDAESYSRVWRKLHELAHGITFDEVNELYGFGNRCIPLGKATPREAKRAVHWEYLAALEQRRLAQEIGFEIPDESANKEINTVLHDALFRVLTGTYPRPSAEGFVPLAELVPIEKALKKIDEVAQKLGLKHDQANFDSEGIIREAVPELTKAFTQGDGETLTDPKSHQAAAGALPPSLMAWGAEKLSPLPVDAIEVLPLDGRIIKVRKVLEDLYSGWIESNGKIIHQFERLTLPLLLSQIQSKLELYGKEDETVAQEKTDGETSIGEKLKRLQDAINEQIATISGSELAAGIENPEKDCEACERSADQCVCYLNLPKPRIEVTAKGVTIFFKSEWSEEDQLNFRSDLVRRAGLVLQRKRLEAAKTKLEQLKKLKGPKTDV
jgi:hypothetical protein